MDIIGQQAETGQVLELGHSSHPDKPRFAYFGPSEEKFEEKERTKVVW